MFVFLFKQKTAYEMLRSLVGSEMCIRDSFNSAVVPFGSGFAGVFRVDSIRMEAGLHTGFSNDGLKWQLEEHPILFECPDPEGPEPNADGRFQYDPRITPIDGAYYVTWCHYPDGPQGGHCLLYTSPSPRDS